MLDVRMTKDMARSAGGLRFTCRQPVKRQVSGSPNVAFVAQEIPMDVTSVMTPNPACCTIDTPLQQVAQLMVDNDCGEIPVVDASRRPVGVVTDRDIAVRIVAQGRDIASATARDCMSTPVVSVDVKASLTDALDVMESKQIRRIPVIDQNGMLVGIVAQADVALHGRDKKTGNLVEEVSKPSRH